jgi:CcmD family protein
MSYLIAAYAITLGTLGVYAWLLIRERRRLAERHDR